MSKEYKEDTQAIEISFAAMVHISNENYKRLHNVVSDICKEYEKHHPDRIMWLFGEGGKVLVHPLALSDDEPIPMDMSILSMECAERERYEGERS